MDKQQILDNHQLLLPVHECHCLDDFICNIDELRIVKRMGSENQRLQSFKCKIKSYENLMDQFINEQAINPSIQNLQKQARQLLTAN